MNESMISSVGKVDTSAVNGAVQNSVSRQVEQQTAAQRSQASKGPAVEEKQQQTQEDQARAGSNRGTMDVHIRFQVDDKTNEVTLLILDRANEKVLRAIPPEEFKKYQGMGLFDLFA